MTRSFARSARSIAWALIALAALTFAMLQLRDRLDKAHVALLYLLIVLGGSAAGREAGLSIGVFAFVLFNFYFLTPFNTLVVNDPLDWLVLFTFLITSIVAAELLNRQRMQTELAERRRAELDKMATLGAETMNAARAEHALAAITRVIMTRTGVARCELYVRDGANSVKLISDTSQGGSANEGLLTYVLQSGRSAVSLIDGTMHVATANEASALVMLSRTTAYAIPLAIGGQTVGVLRVSADKELNLSTEQLRVLHALAYYTALGIDRQRLESTEEAAEELRRVDRLKDALLAAVSHDLRTPLTTIKGLAHEIAVEGSERARIIESEADRLASLVDGLLELSQLNANAMPMHVAVNTSDELIGAALQRAQKLLEHREVVVTTAHDELLSGGFDLAQSVRILVNLLENAAKYSQSDSVIELYAERVGSELQIAVSDRGVGIAAEDQVRIFEPFFRARTATADVRGAGLGLSIAKRLAEAQGGALTVRSRDGGGSVFTLRLPGDARRA